MKIKHTVIEGAAGDIEITRTGTGAMAIRGHAVIAEFPRDEGRDARFAKALEVAKAVYGTDRRGRVNATNSMGHEVLNEIERVAGC